MSPALMWIFLWLVIGVSCLVISALRDQKKQNALVSTTPAHLAYDVDKEVERAKAEFVTGKMTEKELANVTEFWEGHVANCERCTGDHGLCSIHYEWWATGCWPDWP